MALPYLSMNTDQILNMYKIDSIDSLINWIDYTKDFNTINRILNVWIRKNFDELKENNKILLNIYKNIAKKYKKETNNINEENIKNWFRNNKSDQFKLDLAEYIF
jgi:beta-galactosidase/beta-glucuronidase